MELFCDSFCEWRKDQKRHSKGREEATNESGMSCVAFRLKHATPLGSQSQEHKHK